MRQAGSDAYMRASRELRSALRYNRDDALFGTRPRRIVYFFDTNIALNYLIQRYSRGASSLSRLMDAKANAISNRLSYQYLFSGKLPGMLDGDVAVISQPHWNELVSKIRDGAAIMERDLRGLKRLTETEREHLRSVRHNPQDLLDAANKIGLNRIIDQIKAATSFRKRVEVTIGGGAPRLRPLDQSPHWRAIQNKILADDVREWSHLITEARRPRNRGETENIEADAKTLAVIEALYRENVASIGPSAQVRFVFVTSNSAIGNAYRERRAELAAAGIPDFIRSPLVYHPLLNFSAMHRTISADGGAGEAVRRVFLDVENAVGALFPQEVVVGGKMADVRWRRRWDLEDNISRWSSAAEQIATANVGMFADEAADVSTAQEIASYFDSDDLFIAVSKQVHRTIADIERDHARHMAAASFDLLIELLREPWALHRERRAPMCFPSSLDVLQGVDLRSVAGGSIQTLQGLLIQLSASDGSVGTPSVAQSISKALSDRWEEPANQLLATAIYMMMEAWESAVSCADMCVQTARRRATHPIIAREARYCKAVSLRMLLRSQGEIQMARDALNENLSARDRDPLTSLRDRVERSTLMLSACIVHAIEKSGTGREQRGRRLAPLVRDDQLEIQFDNEVLELDLALADLSDNFLGSGGDRQLIDSVIGQAAINRLGAELFRKYNIGDISSCKSELSVVYAKIKSHLDEVPSYELPTMGRVYIGVAEVELGLCPDPRVVIGEIDKSSAVTGLAHGDEHEYAFFRIRMAARARSPLRPR